MSIGRQGRVQVEDIVFLIRKDPRKFARVKDLLTMNEELKRARKAFDEANYGSWFCVQAALGHYLGTCCPKGRYVVCCLEELFRMEVTAGMSALAPSLFWEVFKQLNVIWLHVVYLGIFILFYEMRKELWRSCNGRKSVWSRTVLNQISRGLMMGDSLQLFQLSLGIPVTGNLENASWLTGQSLQAQITIEVLLFALYVLFE